MDRGDVIAQRYRLERPIGAGLAWLATDLTLHRRVALRQGSRTDAGGARRAHPNLVAVFDVVRDDAGQEWLVMEHLSARSLAEVLREEGPLPPAGVARIGAQLAAALAHLHERDVAHGDVTPGNVLVTADRTAKLTDAGVTIGTGGTPGAVHGDPATAAADLYSLGATLATAGEGHPATDPAVAAVLAALLRQDPDRRPTAQQAHQRLTEVAGSDRGRIWWYVAASVLVVAALVLWLVRPFTRPSGAVAVADPPPATTAGGSPLGDPRTADPCALTDAAALSSFGPVGTSSDHGNFNRCDVFVYLGADREDVVDVSVTLATARRDPDTPVRRSGEIGVQRPPSAGDCERILLLPGDHQVVIEAAETGAEPADLCAMADAVTSSALATLNGGRLPRRTLPVGSLAERNACDLLDTATVKSVLGTGSVHREPGYAAWRCDWSTGGRARVEVGFDRNTAQPAPTLIGGLPAVVRPHGGTGCEVALVYRTYTDARDERIDEVVDVDTGDASCAAARRLAGTVAGRLDH